MTIARVLGSAAAPVLALVLAAPAVSRAQTVPAPTTVSSTAQPTPIPIGTTTVKLPEPRRTSATSLEEALLGRKAPRQFGTGPVPLADVGQLLWAAQGITGSYSRRAAPSAGAAFPLEVILVAADVTGLPPAVYRYRPAENELVRIAQGDRRPAIAEACHFPPLAGMPVVIVVTGVGSRTAKIFGALAPKLVTLEAGAASQNLALEAVALGLDCGMMVEFETPKLEQAIATQPGETPYTVFVVTRPAPQAGH